MAATPLTPEQSLARYRDTGDPDAFAALFDATAPALFRIAVATCQDPVVAEDVIQETFLAALGALDEFERGRPVMPWLVGILKNRALRARRDARRAPDPVRVAASRAEVAEPPSTGSAEKDEESRRLRAAIEVLEEPYRSAALLRWVYGLEPAEVAHVRGEPPGTTRSILSRAVERLRVPAGALPAAFIAGSAVPSGLDTVRGHVVAAAAKPVGVTPTAAAATAGGVLAVKKLIVAAVVLLALLGAYFGASSLRSSPPDGRPAAVADASAPGGVDGAAKSAAPTELAASSRAPGATEAAARTAAAPTVEAAAPAATSEATGTASQGNGAVIRGRVVSGEVRLPVAGARVQLLRPDALFKYLRASRVGRFDELTTTTDGEGRFVFRDVLPAKGYAVLARRADGAAVTSQGIDVGARQAADVGDLALGRVGGLAGRVVDAAKRPVVAARVAVTWAIRNEFGVVLADPDTLPWIEFETRTDASGAWTASALEPGEKTVVVRADSGAATVLSPVSCPDGVTQAGVDATLGGSLRIAGKAFWTDGTPLAGACVFAMAPPRPAAHCADTASDGSFHIDGLDAGDYLMGVLVSRQPVKLLSAVAAGTESLRVDFPVTGALSGRVVEAATGKPVPRFRVRPRFADAKNPMALFVTERLGRLLGSAPFLSDDGAFRFDQLGPGPYVLVVDADGYPRTESAPVVVEAGREAVAPAVALPSGHTISGEVVDADGKPVVDARVYVHGDEPGDPKDPIAPEAVESLIADMDAEARTDATGAFRTRPLTPGVFRLGVVAKGRLPVVRSAIDASAGDAERLRIEMHVGSRIRVRAFDSRGQPPGHPVDVLLCDASGMVLEKATDASGALDAGPLRPGRWIVQYAGLAVAAATGADASTRFERLRAVAGAVELSLAEGGTLDATIRVPRQARVRGTIQSGGRGVAGTVVLVTASGLESEDAHADADGAFVVPHVESGSYAVYFRADAGPRDRWVKAGPFAVPDADEHRLDVDLP